MNAKKQLIKDILIAFGGFCLMFVLVSIGGSNNPGDIMGCILGAGVLFGWRIAGNIITAVSLYGILIKFFIAFVIGLPAMPIILIKDIICVVRELSSNSEM